MSDDEGRIGATEKAIRIAAALLLSKKHRTKGVPLSRIKKIFTEHGMSLNQGLMELEKRLYDVGVILKRIKLRHGSKYYETLIAIIDPELNIKEISMFDKTTTAILGLIFYKQVDGKIKISEIEEELLGVIGNKNEVDRILKKVLRKLVREGLIKIVSNNEVKLTEYGLALSPEKEFLEKIILNELLIGNQEINQEP